MELRSNSDGYELEERSLNSNRDGAKFVCFSSATGRAQIQSNQVKDSFMASWLGIFKKIYQSVELNKKNQIMELRSKSAWIVFKIRWI